jgi:ABC-type microcin C transport system duplicated ATPase subunit YejF
MALFVITNDEETVRELDTEVLVLQAGRPVAFGHGTDGLLWTPDEQHRVAS